MVQELYDKMKDNPDLAGEFVYAGYGIEWKVFEKYLVVVSDEYIGIDRILFKRLTDPLTHWHPDDKEIYEDICRLGTKGNVTVIHKVLFGLLGTTIVYSGPASECQCKRKWLFGKYIYLYAK